jgi:hypothetical protein
MGFRAGFEDLGAGRACRFGERPDFRSASPWHGAWTSCMRSASFKPGGPSVNLFGEGVGLRGWSFQFGSAGSRLVASRLVASRPIRSRQSRQALGAPVQPVPAPGVGVEVVNGAAAGGSVSWCGGGRVSGRRPGWAILVWAFGEGAGLAMALARWVGARGGRGASPADCYRCFAEIQRASSRCLDRRMRFDFRMSRIIHPKRIKCTKPTKATPRGLPAACNV